MNRQFEQVAVLMGGFSSERDISLRSGQAAVKGLEAQGYRVTPVDVTQRDWPMPSGVDGVFIALHGAYGEDGEVQARLDALRIPYTGAGALSSRLAMDKGLTKRALEANRIPTASYRLYFKPDPDPFVLPAVIKPVCQGSSIGIHRVGEAGQWLAAMDDAFAYGDCVMAEAYIAGRELTVGIVDGQALPVVEVVAPEGWYGYAAKYTAGHTVYHVPADLPQALRDDAQALALKVFSVLGCDGFGRVDFRLSPAGELFVLELNTIPGLTETSLLPKAAAAAGMRFDELCATLMETARPGDAKPKGAVVV